MSTSEKNIMAMREAIEAMNIDTDLTAENFLPMFPEVEIDADAEIFWVLETNHGTLKIRLMPDVAPNHVRNVMYLTELGFYDDLTFHRVITGFMAQGGCPEGTGMGGPGYRFAGGSPPKHATTAADCCRWPMPVRIPTEASSSLPSPPLHIWMTTTPLRKVVEGHPTLETLEDRVLDTVEPVSPC